MANDYLSLADVAVINDQNLADLEVSDLLDDAPFLAALAAETASNGNSHKYVKETGAPVVGFRDANDGREHDHSEDTLVTVTLKILDASFTIDQAVADVWKDGPQGLIAREARRHLKAAFFHAEEQLIYGTGNDSDGFVGLADSTGLDALADAMVLGAGASGARGSVYAVRTNDMGTDVAAVIGENGNIAMGDTVVSRVAGATGWYPAYFTPITGWLGMQIGGAYSVARYANVGTGATLTDDMLSDLIALFPAGRGPDYLVMNRTKLKQLQQSRTATNATGAPAPFPMESFGVPIIVTDALTDSESAVS